MTRYLLDTNIVSDLVKPQPSASLLAWIAEQADENLCVGAVTVAEIERGLLEMPAGRKRLQLEAWFAGPKEACHHVRRSHSPIRRKSRSRLGGPDG